MNSHDVRTAMTQYGVPPIASKPDTRERDAKVQKHIEAADAAVEAAKQSIREIRREMGFPFARSIRLLEERDEPRGMD